MQECHAYFITFLLARLVWFSVFLLLRRFVSSVKCVKIQLIIRGEVPFVLQLL